MAWPQTRNRAFIGFLAIVTVIMIATSALIAPAQRTFFQAILAVAWFVAFMTADRIGLGSLTDTEIQLDDAIRSKVRRAALEGQPDGFPQTPVPAPQPTDLDHNEVDRQDPRWRQVWTLLEVVSAAASAGSETGPPTASILLAAQHYWHDVRNRRVIGRSPIITGWDYDVYLQVQYQRAKIAGVHLSGEVIANEILATIPPDSLWESVRNLLAEIILEVDQAALFASAASPGGGDLRPSRLDESWRLAQRAYRVKFTR